MGRAALSIYLAMKKLSSMQGVDINMVVLESPILLSVTPHSISVSPINSMVSQGES